MDFEIVWTEPAVADLEAAVRYAAEQSPDTAETLRLELLDSVEVLARLPFIGPAYERDRTGQTRRDPLPPIPHLLPSAGASAPG